MTNRSLLSALIFGTFGLGSKAFLNYLCSDVKVVGLSRLLDELERAREGRKGKGILTVSNHISVVDDPLVWGILPVSHYTRARPVRWSLGAADICFTNPFFSAFFRKGQVLETFRGGGINQVAVNKAIELLNAGEWVHLFPEGKIAQPPHSNLRRLKWGIGRMLMETDQLPSIIPMWLTGFDRVMEETRGFPRFLPRPGKSVSVTFGESDSVSLRLGALRNRPCPSDLHSQADMRATVTRVVQEELKRLGEQVSGEIRDIKEGKERQDR